MLQVNDLISFRENVSHKSEIREADIGFGSTCFCYLLSDEDTFSSAWLKECRGIVFDSVTGKVISRPLHKFFNVNENAETQASSIDWSKVSRVMDKRDGSLISTVNTSAGLKLKSKKTFSSDVAVAAEKWLNSKEGSNARHLCEHVIQKGCTAIFEWTSPDARIVIHYPKSELTLLHVRNNENGKYWCKEKLHELTSKFDVKLVDEPIFDFPKQEIGQKLIDAAKVVEGIEGWVIQFENGDMVKLKTDWYLKRHRAMTFIRERDIAEAVLNESLDDLKSILLGEGADISEILSIEKMVLAEVKSIDEEVERAYEKTSHLDRKEFAIQNKSNHLFGLIMSRYLGNDVKSKEFFQKYILKEKFSLRQLNLIQTVAEVD